MRNIVTAIMVLVLTLGLLSCGGGIITPIKNYTSAHYGIEVNLPDGWAASENGDMGIMHEQGLVSFNSWGQKDFWARAKTTNNPDGSLKSAETSPYIVASQIPRGGAYIALVEISGPPYTPGKIPTEYTLNNLSGLYQPHDWRQDSADSAYIKSFYKAGADMKLVVTCSQNATDDTVNQVNNLLKSWTFVNFSTDTN